METRASEERTRRSFPLSVLTTSLKQTSRSFYLTLRILPRAIRPQISLAYLLARTSDTIADTEILPVEQRLRALQNFRERLGGGRDTPLDFGALAQRQGLTAERALLEQCETSLAMLDRLAPPDRQLVVEVLKTITGGQELDLRRFAAASAEHIVALQDDAALDDYTYRVAGCVGEFWTKMCRAHLFPEERLDDASLLANGVRFGKGLQLVNILRDLPLDLRKGRCYLPSARLAEFNLTPAGLLQSSSESQFRPLYDSYLTRAKGHLAAGWDYTNALPRCCVRVRLACALPILIGVKTLARLGRESVLDPGRRVKISRGEVERLIARTLIRYPWPRAWRGLFATTGKGVGPD
jgi:farnesyl-diphosphate farnesyltransferase